MCQPADIPYAAIIQDLSPFTLNCDRGMGEGGMQGEEGDGDRGTGKETDKGKERDVGKDGSDREKRNKGEGWGEKEREG